MDEKTPDKKPPPAGPGQPTQLAPAEREKLNEDRNRDGVPRTYAGDIDPTPGGSPNTGGQGGPD